jgi:nucleotide-binding universal stress UspA family protein
MSYRTVLVELDGSERDGERLELAAAISDPDKAHVVGLHVISPFYPTMGAFGDASAGLIADVQEAYMQEAAETARQIEERSTAQMKKTGVGFEWRSVVGFASDIVPVHARYVDIAIMGQSDPDEMSPSKPRDLPAQTVLDAGRPVLVMPYIGKYPRVGEKVLVAWNGSRESARAVHDAMPILQNAKRVTVLAINPRDDDHIAGADIAAALARHGVNTEAMKTVSSDVSVGELLLSEAADLDSDLLVMGAYGHSRFRELVLGGASQLMLNAMTLPVLMSH